MTSFETLTLAAYFFVLVILAMYGWHRYYLVYLYMKHKDRHPVPAGAFETERLGHPTIDRALWCARSGI